MSTSCRALPAVLLVLLVCAFPIAAQQAAAPAGPTVTPEQMEQFLLTAEMTSDRPAGEGVTNSRRATFSDGQLTHDVHIQDIDEARAVFETPRGMELNFKDSYRFNIAGYRLAVLLGLDNVPMSVERDIEGTTCAVPWWLDDIAMDEGERSRSGETGPDPDRYAGQVHIMRVFDELIQNSDRNSGNIQWTSDWKMYLIDHTRAFRLGKELRSPDLLERVEVFLFARLRGLTEDSVKAAVGDSLTDFEVETVVARARLLVEFFDEKIAELGEGKVLYVKR